MALLLSCDAAATKVTYSAQGDVTVTILRTLTVAQAQAALSKISTAIGNFGVTPLAGHEGHGGSST